MVPGTACDNLLHKQYILPWRGPVTQLTHWNKRKASNRTDGGRAHNAPLRTINETKPQATILNSQYCHHHRDSFDVHTSSKNIKLWRKAYTIY